MSESWTLGRLLTWTTDHLAEQNHPTPRLDAELLLAHARNCARIDLYAAYHDEADAATRDTFRELVRQRAAGAPVAYLIGYREFYSLKFQVTPAVLIPRPETEHLVIAALDWLKQGDRKPTVRIADIGTGSGIIAISIAKHWPDAELWACDISAAALEIARSNGEAHAVSGRVEWVQSDLFSAAPDSSKFDLVVSNPPYVMESELAQLAVDVREFEPHQALCPGPRGIETIERLIPAAAERLLPAGLLVLEISPQIRLQVEQLLEQDGRYEAVSCLADLSGQPRVVQAIRSSP